MKYKVGGREKLLALGEWHHTSLKRARERRDEVRRLLADGVDPAAKKKAERRAIADTFSALAREYLDTKRSSLNPKTLSKAEWLLDDWLNMYVGKIPVRQLAASDVDRDPCGDLRGALTPVKTKNHAAITDPAKVGELLRAIDGYQGQPATAFALKIAPYVFARPGELRAAAWLRDFGFRVMEAADAGQAIKILDRNLKIDLLFTDIGLPGLNGRELAAAVHRRYPSVRLLFTSGYAQMPGPTSSNALADIPLLSKPFTRAKLYRRILESLKLP